MKKLLLAFSVFIFFFSSQIFSQADDNENDSNLAKITIIPFENRTNSANFKYLSESLSEAISNSMLKDFSFIPTEKDALKNGLYNAEQKVLEKRMNSKKNDEESEADKKQYEIVKQLAKDLSSDIMIYGSYIYDDQTNEIVFHVHLFFPYSKAVIDLEETRNPVDNTLFKATANVAKSLVEEIHNMVEKSKKATVAKADEENKTEKNKPKQVEITKEVARGPVDWKTNKFALSLSPGFLMDLNPVRLTKDLCGTCVTQASLRGRFWIIPQLYFGMDINFSELFSYSRSFGENMILDSYIFAGAGIPVDRVYFSFDAGAGYFLMIDKVLGVVYNPAFEARISTDILLSTNFAIGVSGIVYLYYDSSPLIFGGPMINITFLFR